MATLLSKTDLEAQLKRIPEWESNGRAIERLFEFDDFSAAMDFVNAVADIAEEEDHHPDIDIRWNKVRLLLATHSEGGLTELDCLLARKIDHLHD